MMSYGLLHPNKDEIDTNFILNNIVPDLSFTCGKSIYTQHQLNKGGTIMCILLETQINVFILKTVIHLLGF